jgi:hypothetical protein
MYMCAGSRAFVAFAGRTNGQSDRDYIVSAVLKNKLECIYRKYRFFPIMPL